MSSYSSPRYVPSRRAHRVDHELLSKRTPIYVSGPPDLDAATLDARRARGFGWVLAQFGAILDFLVDALLELKNEAWVEEGVGPVTPDEFRTRLQLKEVTIAEDGSVTVVFADRGLFWGHDVVMETDPHLRPTSADLEG